MAIYKGGRRVELGSTMKQLQTVVRVGLQVLRISCPLGHNASKGKLFSTAWILYGNFTLQIYDLGGGGGGGRGLEDQNFCDLKKS